MCHAKVAGSAPSMVGKVSSASPILKSGYILAMLLNVEADIMNCQIPIKK